MCYEIISTQSYVRDDAAVVTATETTTFKTLQHTLSVTAYVLLLSNNIKCAVYAG